MQQVVFLQSDSDDPYTDYRAMSQEHPIFWDESNELWAVYRYRDCKRVLQDSTAYIPPQSETVLAAMNERSRKLVTCLIRLNNGQYHDDLRKMTLTLFNAIEKVDVSFLLEEKIDFSQPHHSIDWVSVSRFIPASMILQGFGFSAQAREIILEQVVDLTKIMLPKKTPAMIDKFNDAADIIFPIVEKLLNGNSALTNKCLSSVEEKDMTFESLVCNFIGLLIQSIDAGRGVLSNAMRQCLLQSPGTEALQSKQVLKKMVVESLRFDPAIHNTRRKLTKPIHLGDVELKTGDSVLIVLAAANRDGDMFADPDIFDADRHNNSQHLTYGEGPHRCLADHFAVEMVVDALHKIFTRYPNTQLEQRELAYEPIGNARLPKSMIVLLK